MIIQFADLKPLQRYHMMTQTIIPRPIAWVLTENDNGSSNLAPFSYFTALCSDPALVVLSIGKKPDGSLKDTRHNPIANQIQNKMFCTLLDWEKGVHKEEF